MSKFYLRIFSFLNVNIAFLFFIASFCIVALFSAQAVFAAQYQLSGKITDQSNNLLAGSTVEIFTEGTTTVVLSTITDSNGNYNLSIEEGIYDIQVVPPAGSNFQKVITLAKRITENTILDFVLVPSETHTVSGQLLDALGTGLPNQGMSIIGNGSQYGEETNASGNYSIEVAAGEYKVEVSRQANDSSINAPYAYSLKSSSNISITQNLPLNIQLPFKKVHVHVQDVDDNPIVDTIIKTSEIVNEELTLATLPAKGTSGYPANTAITNASGDVDLWLFPTQGEHGYQFTAFPPSESNLGQAILENVLVSEDTSVTITLPKTYTISGQITDALGSALSNQSVSVIGDGLQYGATTDASGNYSVDVPTGDYKLEVSKSANEVSINAPYTYSIKSNSTINITQDTQFNIQLPFKKVHVHVQDVAENPVADTIIRTSEITNENLMLASLPASGKSSYQSHTAGTNISGDVDLWLFPTQGEPGYQFTAFPPAESDLGQALIEDVIFSEDTAITITLPETHTIIGRITDALGSGLPNQSISVIGDFQYGATTDASGNYSINVPTGDYKIEVSKQANEFSVNAPYSYSIKNNSNFAITHDMSVNI